MDFWGLRFLKATWKALANKWIAFFASFFILLGMLIWFASAGQQVIAIVAGYLLADLLFNLLIRGGKGIFQFRFWRGTEAIPHGYAFVLFYLMILGSTIFVGIVVDGLTTAFIKNNISNLLGQIILAGACSIMVLFNLHLRFGFDW